MSALATPRISPEEYLAQDRVAEFKSEYHDGEVFPASGVSWEHGRIHAAATRRIEERLDGSPCQLIAASVRLRVSPTKYVYPDLMVLCGAVFTDEQTDTVTNPKLSAEILSPSTADYDYGAKLRWYRSLPSLEEYVLISQDAPRVEVYQRLTDQRWVLATFEGWDSVLPLESLAISLPLAEIYSDVLPRD